MGEKAWMWPLKTTETPKIPTPTPMTVSQADVEPTRAAERQRLKQRKGMLSTILTGGLGEAAVKTQTLGA